VKKKPARPQKPQLTGHGAPPAGGSGAAAAPVRRGRPAPRKPAPRGAPAPPPQGYAVPGHGAPGPLPGGTGAPAPAKKPAPKKKPVKRKLALGESVACCSAEALAASLRLTGRRVSDADVLTLYERTADGPDAGASIVATLEAASACGLAGVRPSGIHERDVLCGGVAGTHVGVQHEPELHVLQIGELDLLDDCTVALLDRHEPFGVAALDGDGGHVGWGDPALIFVHPLILGLDLPEGPHAVLDDGNCWWSWGEPYDPAAFPGAVIEEAWAVTW